MKNKRPRARGKTGESLAAYLALTPALEEDALLQTLLQCAMQVVGAGGAGLTLLDERKKRLVFRAAIGDGAEGIVGQEVPLKGSRHGLAFATGEVQSDTPTYSGLEKKAKARFRNVLVAPLLVAGEPVGTISAVNKQNAEHFSPGDMAAYKLFADLAAVVLRQRCREQILRRGFAQGRRASIGLPVALAPEDGQLLAVFDAVARLRQRRPERLGMIKQMVEALSY
jgi:GAF domain-containing protein